jgi:hypothetical protein
MQNWLAARHLRLLFTAPTAFEIGWHEVFLYSKGPTSLLLGHVYFDAYHTKQISWNSVNAFPHTSFKWVGLDGTQVLTHMAPT